MAEPGEERQLHLLVRDALHGFVYPSDNLDEAAEAVLDALGIERLNLMSAGTAAYDRLAWGHRYNIGDRVVSVTGEHKYDRDVPLFRVRAAEQFGSTVEVDRG